MTQKLEALFGLADVAVEDVTTSTDHPIAKYNEEQENIQTLENQITISEKIDSALEVVRGMESHDGEMDDIAKEALESYKQLMIVGFNMTDMAAGPVFSNAAAMLKIALEAKDSKVTRKLKQIDLMIKKANLDKRNKKDEPEEDEGKIAKTFDRNDLLKMLNQKDD